MFRVLSVCFLVLSLSLGVQAKVKNQRLTTYEEIKSAADDACVGKTVNASCQVTIDNGATFQVGICVQLPSSSPTGAQLTCQLNIPDIVANCKNFAFGRDPDTTLTVGGLLTLLLVLRRSKRKVTIEV